MAVALNNTEEVSLLGYVCPINTWHVLIDHSNELSHWKSNKIKSWISSVKLIVNIQTTFLNYWLFITFQSIVIWTNDVVNELISSNTNWNYVFHDDGQFFLTIWRIIGMQDVQLRILVFNDVSMI